MRYFYNSWDPAYKSHFGAIARNQSCQFTICLPEETPLDFSPVLVVMKYSTKTEVSWLYFIQISTPVPENVRAHG